MIVSADDAIAGSASVAVECHGESGAQFACNGRYLLQAIKGSGSVEIAQRDDKSPIVVRCYIDGVHTRTDVIMPMV